MSASVENYFCALQNGEKPNNDCKLWGIFPCIRAGFGIENRNFPIVMSAKKTALKTMG